MILEPPLHGFWERCGSTAQSMYYFNGSHGHMSFKRPKAFFGATRGCESCSFPSLINSNIISGWAAHFDTNIEENNKDKIDFHFDSPKNSTPTLSLSTIPKYHSKLSSTMIMMSQSLKPLTPSMPHPGHKTKKTNPNLKHSDSLDIFNTSSSSMTQVCRFFLDILFKGILYIICIIYIYIYQTMIAPPRSSLNKLPLVEQTKNADSFLYDITYLFII
jgi:hypothetical protein